MNNNSSAIIALVIITVAIIIVVISLSWHPAPVVVQKQPVRDPVALLREKQSNSKPSSVFNSPRDQAIKSPSESSVNSDAWATIRALQVKNGINRDFNTGI